MQQNALDVEFFLRLAEVNVRMHIANMFQEVNICKHTVKMFQQITCACRLMCVSVTITGWSSYQRKERNQIFETLLLPVTCQGRHTHAGSCAY